MLASLRAKRSNPEAAKTGLLRRFAPRNDDDKPGKKHRHPKEPRASAASKDVFVMRGLDPRIHHSSQESSEDDGLPGQARQ